MIDATGFDDQIMFDDTDETVFFCKAPDGPMKGKEIGVEPITCEAFEPPSPGAGRERLRELDELIAKRGFGRP